MDDGKSLTGDSIAETSEIETIQAKTSKVEEKILTSTDLLLTTVKRIKERNKTTAQVDMIKCFFKQILTMNHMDRKSAGI